MRGLDHLSASLRDHFLRKEWPGLADISWDLLPDSEKKHWREVTRSLLAKERSLSVDELVALEKQLPIYMEFSFGIEDVYQWAQLLYTALISAGFAAEAAKSIVEFARTLRTKEESDTDDN